MPDNGLEVTEEAPLEPRSPYARTKSMMEQVLVELCAATSLRAVILRYFNPIGSDPDLESGVYAREPSHVLGQMMLAATTCTSGISRARMSRRWRRSTTPCRGRPAR